jgi:hypothetical protein
MWEWVAEGLTFKDDWCIGAYQDGTGPCATCRSGVPFCVDGNIAGKHNGISTIPRTALYPVDGIEESSS